MKLNKLLSEKHDKKLKFLVMNETPSFRINEQFILMMFIIFLMQKSNVISIIATNFKTNVYQNSV